MSETRNATRERAAGLRSLLRQLPLFLILVLLWALLWGDFSALTLLTGVLIALGLPRVFFLPPVEATGRISVGYTLVFLVRMVYDVVTASLKVAWQSINWRYHPVNAVIAVPLRTKSDLIMSLTAEAISLVPGSSVIEVDRETMTLYLHVLGADTARKVELAKEDALRLEARIILSIGDRTEAAALRNGQSIRAARREGGDR